MIRPDQVDLKTMEAVLQAIEENPGEDHLIGWCGYLFCFTAYQPFLGHLTPN